MTDRSCVYVWPEGRFAGRRCCDIVTDPDRAHHEPGHWDCREWDPRLCDYHVPVWEDEPEREGAGGAPSCLT
jgi:hypothetical protein